MYQFDYILLVYVIINYVLCLTIRKEKTNIRWI